jgi:hypothetical protein
MQTENIYFDPLPHFEEWHAGTLLPRLPEPAQKWRGLSVTRTFERAIDFVRPSAFQQFPGVV